MCAFLREKNMTYATRVTAALGSNTHKMNPHMLNGNVTKFCRKAKRTNNTKLRSRNGGDLSISQERVTLV